MRNNAAAALDRLGRAALALALVVAFAAVSLAASPALAQEVTADGRMIGQSAPGQLDLQTPATLVGYAVTDFHHFMLYIITGITLFVLALLIIVIVRYNRAANPKPATWTHNTPLEIVWTTTPVVLLVMIAIPSVRLLQLQEDFTQVEPDIVIKATGYQWYWGYEYQDEGIEFESLMLGLNQAEMNDEVRDELAAAGYPERAWKLATDTAVVVPVDKTVLVQVTAADVIHAWAIPAFSVKADGVPGRINQTWFRAEHEGVFFGQCSELCGRNHSYMPITVKVVSEEAYADWVQCVQQSDVYACPTVTMNEILAEAPSEAATEIAAAR